MKVLALLCLVGVSAAARVYQIYSIEQADDYFQEFIDTYDKEYADEAEKAKRFDIFKQNLGLINQKNAHSSSPSYGINMFSDLTEKEFIATYTGFVGGKTPQASACESGTVNSSAPDSFSWTDSGVVSKAKNQGRCGSCWAFSAIGNVEAAYAIRNSQLLDLSEQQVVDCDTRSMGCDGTSDIEYPFLYLIENTGSMNEADYPYQAVRGDCKFDQSKVKVNVVNCVTFHPSSEDELRNVLHGSGPLSIAVDAAGFQSYTNHVLSECPFMQLNHAVLLVGYGTEDGTPYWLIKNSWGEGFGEDGFIKVRRGVNACGLMNGAMTASVVN